MGPIDTLMEEHRRIEEVLGALSRFVSGLTGAEAAEREELGRFTEFFRGFADAYHHGKEEDILFRALEEHGMSPAAGPLGVMLHEHEEGRSHVRALAEIAKGAGPLDGEERSRAASHGRDFAGLLGDHILKEDQILYPMAGQLLPSEAWFRISDEFEAHATAHAETGERLRALGASLAGRSA